MLPSVSPTSFSMSSGVLTSLWTISSRKFGLARPILARTVSAKAARVWSFQLRPSLSS
jgi:hypothetical protein